MFDLFWDQCGFPGSESIFGNLVLLGFHVGSSGAPFWKPGDVQRVLGSLWHLFLVTFEGPEAPGRAPGGSLCSKGGLDRFWNDFGSHMGGQGSPNASQDDAKMHQKIMQRFVDSLTKLCLIGFLPVF